MSSFEKTGLREEILKAVQELGFLQPTPIQEKMIPQIIQSKKDVIALAQTGTGKTAAFGLPLLHNINSDARVLQTLILCPTRELCLQICRDLKNFSKYMQDVSVVPVYGGAPITNQIKALKKGCQIVVGTPGRIHDVVRRDILKLQTVQWLVLDEADEMLTMGFKEELDAIISKIPAQRQTLLFSATMPKEIVAEYTNKPIEISIGRRNASGDNIENIYYTIQAKHRYETLKRIADVNPDIYAIVFCRTRQETKDVADQLIHDGYNAEALHGDLAQLQRDYVMQRFRNRHLQLLVATDVAARGLDVNNLTHVIHYTLPDDIEVYIHRSGRTGRAGRKGTAISILHTREMTKLRAIEKKVGKEFVKGMVPSGKEICKKQLFTLVDKVKEVEVNTHQIDEFLPSVYEKLASLSREELITHFVSVEFNRFLAYYNNAEDVNVKATSKKSKKGNDRSVFSRFCINAGTKHKLNAARLIGLINEKTRKRNIEIGKIEIMKYFSYFEIESSYETYLVQKFKKATFAGIKLEVAPAQKKQIVKKTSRKSSKRRKNF